MQRRKLTIGLGAIATGGIAGLGTTLFGDDGSDRTIDIRIAADSLDTLRLGASADPNGQYVTGEMGELASLDLTSLATASPDRSQQTLESVVEVINQGRQTVRVGVTVPAVSDATGAIEVFVSRPELAYSDGAPRRDGQSVRRGMTRVADLPALAPGDGITIGIRLPTDGDGEAPTLADPLRVVAVSDTSSE